MSGVILPRFAVPLCATALALAQAPPATDVIARVTQATVLVLTGVGAGRLSGISSGAVVRPSGIILVAYHAVKDAREVQVRLRSGDVYDRAVLIGVDERRDVAAIRISAADLPSLPVGRSQDVKAGDTAYLVSSSAGLSWSASQGIFAGSRIADEIPGAGEGYRVLQFTAPVARGASGGPVVNEYGALVGIITKAVAAGAGFAVPIDAVIGLADGTGNLALGEGSALKPPAPNPSPSSAAIAQVNPAELLRSAKTFWVYSRTTYFTPDNLSKELTRQTEFAGLSLLQVGDRRLADLAIEIDRPLFTYTFTFSVTDTRTSVILQTGKVTAIDGGAAAGKIAKALVAAWVKGRQPSAPKTN